MEMTLRWYGSKFDTVTLKQIRQLPELLQHYMIHSPVKYGTGRESAA